MHLPKSRNDRVLLGTTTALAALALVVGTDFVLSDPFFAEICSSVTGSSARADTVTSARQETFHSQPARGPVPHAHNVAKIVKTDQPVSIVRDPTDIPSPVGKRVNLPAVSAARNESVRLTTSLSVCK